MSEKLWRECGFSTCEHYDWGSEGSCWLGKFDRCGKRVAWEMGCMLVEDVDVPVLP